MSNNEPMIQLPQEAYLRLLRAVDEYQDDHFDQDMALEDFRKAYEDESDSELERKRKIMRNRILDKYEPEISKNKYDILTEIIKANARRRHAFERQKEVSQWLRMAVTLLVGGLLGYFFRGTAR